MPLSMLAYLFASRFARKLMPVNFPCPPLLLSTRCLRFLPPVLCLTLVLSLYLFPILSLVLSSFPACGMRRYFGFPCPLCGGSRAFAAWSSGLPLSGFLLNPLLSLLGLGIVFWFLFWLLCPLWSLRCPRWLWTSLSLKGSSYCLLLCLLFHWLYLCLTLPT